MAYKRNYHRNQSGAQNLEFFPSIHHVDPECLTTQWLLDSPEPDTMPAADAAFFRQKGFYPGA